MTYIAWASLSAVGDSLKFGTETETQQKYFKIVLADVVINSQLSVGLQRINWIVIGCTTKIKEPEDNILFEREMTENTIVKAALLSLIYRMCVQSQATGCLF